MIYIFLSILSSTSLFVIFKLLDKFKIETFNVIVLNYLIAAILGFIVNINFSVDTYTQSLSSWYLPAAIIGVLFILMFFVIGKSAQVIGIGITSVASKMSVIFPIVFSILYFAEDVTTFKIAGVLIALVAIVLTVFKKSNGTKINPQHIYLPAILFVGMGMVDILIKIAQNNYIEEKDAAIFTSTLFAISFITGVIISFFKKGVLKAYAKPKVLLLGLILGIVNFGSIYFLINALNTNILDSSAIFGINNIGIVSLSIVLGLAFFKEKLSALNWVGIILSITAIYLLSNS